ncbi:endonuclease/exonuclease/phosphatase family protein [Psychromonas aquimarina]|uniref:endonuclease/exonuclease/phosphatase family protein n=1 Tax=Psychromonas aquimarina TaxID=444919 RepID=UPI000404A9B9|nr:endonuclease/exonuclease/phosphatase family protein [Psychromonas aquimarina]
MKSNIIFPVSITFIKSCLIILILLFAIQGSADSFFPESPAQLTVFDNNQQFYHSACPELSSVRQPVGIERQISFPFTLLNWNIYKQQNKNWRSRLQEWSAKADLFTLQEVKHSIQLKEFSRANQLFYLHNYAFKYAGFVYGVNTLSKFPATQVCATRYSEPWIIVPKTGLAATYSLANSNQTLLVINLHGVNFTFTSQPLKDQLQPYLSLIKQHNGPILFSGDFNTWTDARLDDVEQALIKSGFKETLFHKDQRTSVFGLPLDHVYYRGLKVINSESISTEASDHNPQLVTFDIE